MQRLTVDVETRNLESLLLDMQGRFITIFEECVIAANVLEMKNALPVQRNKKKKKLLTLSKISVISQSSHSRRNKL